jgi:hypothetical protein
LLGWAPKVPLREGLTRTISYFEQLLEEVGVGRMGNYAWGDVGYTQFAG